MTRFRYRAVDDKGKAFSDTMEAASARQVVARLRERGLTVNTVEELDKPRGLLRVSEQLTWEELQLFTQQLHAITHSDLPLAPALKTLADDLHGGHLKSAIEALYRDIEQGLSLDEALERRHAHFPALFADIVRAGQAAGNLSGVLQMYLRYTERMVAMKGALKSAMVYPLLVVAVGLCIMVFMLMTVIPLFADMFQEFGGPLPAPTRFWVGVSDSFRLYWPYLLVGGLVAAGAVYLVRKSLVRIETGRIALEWLRLRMPVWGRLRYLMVVSRFARTLALLLASRVPMMQSLELAGAVSGSPLLQRALDDAALRIANGERLADAMAGTGFFAYHFCWLLGMGEDRGEAELALDGAADAMERELAGRDRMFGALLGPLLVIVVGGIIGIMVFSLYLPIFALGDIITGN